MGEFSKTIRFDFPRIPIIGTLLLIILLISYPDTTSSYLYDENEKMRKLVSQLLLHLSLV